MKEEIEKGRNRDKDRKRERKGVLSSSKQKPYPFKDLVWEVIQPYFYYILFRSDPLYCPYSLGEELDYMFQGTSVKELVDILEKHHNTYMCLSETQLVIYSIMEIGKIN